MATELLTLAKAAPHGRSRRLDIVPAHDVSWAEQAVVFTAAFSGYVGGSFEMDAAALARFICAQGADVLLQPCHQSRGLWRGTLSRMLASIRERYA